MSHLPECMHSDEWQPYCCPECTPGVVPEWEQVCICDRLRACEQRVTEELTARLTTAYEWVVTDERNRALDEAREAVERVSSLLQPLGPALAAIDALRREASE